jgi:hypothetical protein
MQRSSSPLISSFHTHGNPACGLVKVSGVGKQGRIGKWRYLFDQRGKKATAILGRPT